jgi:hypothetical protein
MYPASKLTLPAIFDGLSSHAHFIGFTFFPVQVLYVPSMWQCATVRRIRQGRAFSFDSHCRVRSGFHAPADSAAGFPDAAVGSPDAAALIVLPLILLLLRVCLALLGRALLALLTLLLILLPLALILLLLVLLFLLMRRLLLLDVPLLLLTRRLTLLVLLFLLMRRLLLLKVPLLLLTRRLALLVLLLVPLILLMRRLLLLKVPLLLLARRLALLFLLLVMLISLLRRLVCPVLLLSEPVGTIRFYPIRILLVPPSAVMPLALLIVGAILIPPSRVERGPILMILIKPVGIVLMPPIGVAPLMLVVVVSPLGFGRSRGPVFVVQGLPYVRMGPEVLLQLGMLTSPIGIVEQPGIPRECPRNVRMVREEISKALVSLVLRHIVEPWIVIRKTGYLQPANLNRDLRRRGRCNGKREQDRTEPHHRFYLLYS